jgi:hypothetical protein
MFKNCIKNIIICFFIFIGNEACVVHSLYSQESVHFPPIHIPLSDYTYLNDVYSEKIKDSILTVFSDNKNSKDGNFDISIPKFPDNYELSTEFELFQFFQERTLVELGIANSDKLGYWLISPCEKNGKIILKFYESPVISFLDKLRVYFRKKWQVEIPQLYPDLWIPPVHMLPPSVRIKLEKENDVFRTPAEKFKSATLQFSYFDRDSDQITCAMIPEHLSVLVLSSIGEKSVDIYCVCAYNNSFQKEEDALYFSSKTHGQLRYIFLGMLRDQHNLIGKINVTVPFGEKKRREDFQPTGNIIYFDKEGSPTHWYSIKEGKFMGRQIQWNKEGKIIHDENITEAKDNCDSIWVEFGRSKF